MSLKSAQAGINVTFQQVLSQWAAALPDGRLRREKLEEKIELRPGATGASALRARKADPAIADGESSGGRDGRHIGGFFSRR
jgi:hypothetical protein